LEKEKETGRIWKQDKIQKMKKRNRRKTKEVNREEVKEPSRMAQ
jgi:hypothetical protein